MHLAFALFKYFPYGGLQQDMLRIAQTAVERGHYVTVFCGSWQGDEPADIDVIELTMSGSSNIAQDRSFVTSLQQALAEYQFDLIVGFNRMPGLDVYYAADSCFAAKVYEQRSWFSRFLPRYKHHLTMEQAVFGEKSDTHILLISQAEQAVFQQYYQTPKERLYLLPPGIRRDRVAPLSASEIRAETRRQLGFVGNKKLVLMVGSGFRTKGLDRAITAIASLPSEQKEQVVFCIAGQDKPDKFAKQAAKLGVAEYVHFLGGRDDVPNLLLAADLLIHPAYREAAGMALLEAMVAGLPVLTTDVCGYAHYVDEHNMGEVLLSPFMQYELNTALQNILFDSSVDWRQRGAKFARTADIYDLPLRAVEQIEAVGQRMNNDA